MLVTIKLMRVMQSIIIFKNNTLKKLNLPFLSRLFKTGDLQSCS